MFRKLIAVAVFFLVLALAGSVSAELLVHYGFDETSGSTAVDSTGGNDGTVAGGTWATPGAAPQTNPGHLVLNVGSVEVPGLPSQVGAFTMMLWLNKSGGPRFPWLVGTMGGGANLQICIEEDGNPGQIEVGCGGGWQIAVTGFSSGSWVHMAFVREVSGAIKMYLDGNLEHTFSCGAANIDLSTLMIGKSPAFADRYLDGGYDDFAIFDEALDEEAVIGKMTYGVAGMVVPTAGSPRPSDAAEDVRPDVELRWAAGTYASLHDVYFGTDYNDVSDADTSSSEYKGSQERADRTYAPGFLELGKRYFWRIDEVNDACEPYLWKGAVWSFTVDDGKAKNPDPGDGRWGVPLAKVLSWTPGILVADVNGHDVYFGTDFDDVNDANTSSGVYKGRQTDPNYDPGALEAAGFYYWRIDEVNDANLWKGVVWSFRAGGLLLAEYSFDSFYYDLGKRYVPDTSGFGYDGLLSTGAYAARAVDDRKTLYLINNSDPLTYGAANMQLPPEFGKVNPFDGSGDFTIMMDFKVADVCDPCGILISSARDNSRVNHAMNIFIRADGSISYDNWHAGSVDTGKGYGDGEWHNLAVTHQASDHLVSVTVDDVESRGTVNPDIPNIEEDTVMVGWSLETLYPAEDGAALDFYGYIDNLQIYDYAIHCKAWNEQPPHEGADVHPDVVLTWAAGYYAASHDVYFGTSEADVNESASPISAGQALDANSYDPPGSLDFSGIYYWRVDEVNGTDVWTGHIWTFTVTDGSARNPGPADDGNRVHPDVVLTWSPGGAWVDEYDVYFSDNWDDVNDRSPVAFKGTQGVDSNSYNPGGLELGKTYYWRVDEANETNPDSPWLGGIWSFTVDDGKAHDPDPADGNDAALPDADLSWTPGIVATSHDLYFGLDFEDVNNGTGGTFKANLVGVNSYDPGPLTLGVTYYWRVDARGQTIVKGDVWSFTVEHGKASRPRPWSPSVRIALDRILTWTPGKYATSCDIYFGTDFDDVNDGAGSVFAGRLPADTNSYDPEGFTSGTTYYWRVEGLGPEPRLSSKGDVWVFKTINLDLQTILMMDISQNAANLKEGWTLLTKTDDNPPGSDTYDSSGDQTGPLTWVDVNGPDGNSTGIDITLDVGASGNLEGRTRRGEPLCRDYFFADDAEGAPDGDFIMKFGDLPAGDYELATYHNNNEEDISPTLIGRVEVGGAVANVRGDAQVTQTNTLVDEECGLSHVTFAATGTGKVTVRYVCDESNRSAVFVNGFILEYALGDPAFAHSPRPSGAEAVHPGVVLSWSPGLYAHGPAAHEVYFGADFSEVSSADTSWPVGTSVYKGAQSLDANSYDPPGYLELGESYYWRVDEVNDISGERWKGSVWNFTVAEYILVDNFESYDANHPLVYDEYEAPNGVWIDGLTNFTTSKLGLVTAPNDLPVRGTGTMEFGYDNYSYNFYGKYYAEASRPIGDDWVNTGVKALSVWFHGDPNNDLERMYVALEDDVPDHIVVVPYDGDFNDVNKAEWQEWHIKLEDFKAGDVNLAAVSTFYLGFGDRENPQRKGSGIYSYVYFDDIGVYPNRCVAKYGPKADLDGDCVVDLNDLDILARDWLDGDYTASAVAPDSSGLVLYYEFDAESGIEVTDASGHGHDGEVDGPEDAWDSNGYSGGCRLFDDDTAVLVPSDTLSAVSKAVSVSLWLDGYRAGEDNWVLDTGSEDLRLQAIVPTTEGNVYFRAGEAEEAVTWEDSNSSDWLDSWNHYAFVKDSVKGVMRMYHNGVPVAEKRGVTTSLAALRDTDFKIGATTSHSNDYIGKMDEFRIYNYALSAGEVIYLAEVGLTLYVPLVSEAELYGEEPENFKKVNMKDFAILADQWLDVKWYPEGP